MARAIWTGSLSFGLVNVPVGLYSAVEEKDVRFHQFEKGTNRRIRYRRVAEGSDTEVDYSDIVKGYEVEPDRWVVIEPEELESVEPGRSRTIDIEDFVDLAEIDPIYYERTYFLAPGADQSARSYSLLREAMCRAGRVGIARFVMRGKQYLAAIRPRGDVLVLETMYFGDEVRDPVESIDALGAGTEDGVDERELDVALQLVDALTSAWEPERYRDTYRERVMELIERKARGETVRVEEPEGPPEGVVDLMAALQASLERGGRRRGADGGLDEMTVPELQGRARDAGISGRSKMNKDELIDALRRAS